METLTYEDVRSLYYTFLFQWDGRVSGIENSGPNEQIKDVSRKLQGR